MKKICFEFIVIAAVALAFSSCSKVEEQSMPNTENLKTVVFKAVSPETKTTFGSADSGKYPTIWTANDSEIKIAQNFATGVTASVTKDSDAEASFSAEFTDDESGSYTFYAVSPASAVVSGVNSTYYSWNLEIPTTQTPTATGPDESAMILAAKSSTVATFPSSVNLNFSHVTAYVKMSITNLGLAPGDEVASVLVSADADIAYRYYYYVGGAKAGTLEENSGNNAITILTTSASDIWFACAPMASGTELTISVTTKNSKVYTKVINTPAALAAGHIATFSVNFSGITPPDDKVYHLVTSYSELTAGSKVVIAAVGVSDYAAGIGTTSDNFISAVSQAKSVDDSKITNPASTVDIFTIEAGSTSNTIALNGTNGYLYAKSASSNQMGIQATKNVDGDWSPTITDLETGAMSLVATGSSNRNYMHYNYNGGSPRFSCYSSTSSVTDLQALYKLEGTGSGPALVTTYTVTYDGNGNTGGTAPASVVTPGAFTVASEGTLEKSGYNFTGWNTAADGSGTAYAAGDDAVATANMTLYAQWALAGPGGTATFTFGDNITSTSGTQGAVTLSSSNSNHFNANTGNAPAYNTTSQELRIYRYGSLTLSSSKNITGITITYSSNSYVGSDTGSDVGTYSCTGDTGSWTGSAKSVQISNKGTSNVQMRIKKIVVTYE